MEKPNVIEENLGRMEEEYAKTKHNKATNKALGILRAKIAKAKKDIIEAGKGKKGSGFFVKKIGDATVALVGFPSAGKSSLLNRIANAKSKVAAYAFTTTTIVPGMMLYKDAHIQIFDLPGIIENAHAGIGGGRTVLAAAKSADLMLFVIDAKIPNQMDIVVDELFKLNIFINKKRPDVQILETKIPGIKIEINKSGIEDKSITAILEGFGIHNCSVRIRSIVGEDEIIAIISKKAAYMPAIVALNKIDIAKNYAHIADDISKKYNINVVPISVIDNKNIDILLKSIYDNLGIMTVYMRPRIESEKKEPMILKTGSTIGVAAKKIHTQILDQFKCAYIDGPSAKFSNQRVGITHILKDGDIVTFIND
ncbi:MAG: 50S ribosome-binding GTPase [Candidatus Marsarchaeota archaeon]|nr:50S ribosome-binding GTPase [Candidatus Marsarchaeota archaeon]